MNRHIKKDSQLNNFVVKDFETFHTIKVVPYCDALYRIGEIAGNSIRDLKKDEYQKIKKIRLFLMELIVLLKCPTGFSLYRENLKNKR